jgi:hypothetical protein
MAQPNRCHLYYHFIFRLSVLPRTATRPLAMHDRTLVADHEQVIRARFLRKLNIEL